MGVQRLEVDAAGRPVLVKLAAAGPAADRLRHEAEVLHVAAHPGVAQLLGLGEQQDGGVELRLAVAGTRTFADVRADLAGGVRVLASLATTLADLHDLGIVHGRVSADHVVIDAEGRPVLCGFAEAARRGALEPAVDVLGLGRLLASLLHGVGAAGGDDWEPIPERRFAPGDRWTGFARRALLTLADHATAEDPSRRPTARAFAAAVLTALPPLTVERPARHRAVLAAVRARVADRSRRARPGGTGPGDAPVLDAVAMLEVDEPAPAPPPRRPVLPGGWVAPLAGAVGLGLLVFGVGALLRPAGPAPTSTSPPTSTGEPAIATTATTASACAAVPEPSADPDGDGCPSSVRVGDAEVEVDGVRYGVGRPGDLLAVGDWDCDGSATVALVRRGTGEVFVFDGWAGAGVAVTAASTGTVPGARSLAPTEHPDGCDALVVVDDVGRRTEVPA